MVCPLALFEGSRNTETVPSVSSQRIMRLLGMSDQMRYRPAGKYAGPSTQRPPDQRRSIFA